MGATVEISEIVSTADIARICGVSTSAVSNWRTRHETFPAPFTSIANGRTPLFRKREVVKWHIDHHRPPLYPYERTGVPR